MMAEIRSLPGYAVTDSGNVFSLVSRWGPRPRPLPLTAFPNKDGYLTVIVMENGKRKVRMVHQLVAEAFVGPRPSGMVVCHENGVCVDNYPENLRYKTIRDNNLDKQRHGTQPRGESHGRAKLTEPEARSIAESQLSTAELMRKFNVTENIVTKIKHKRTWRHLYDSK